MNSNNSNPCTIKIFLGTHAVRQYTQTATWVMLKITSPMIWSEEYWVNILGIMLSTVWMLLILMIKLLNSQLRKGFSMWNLRKNGRNNFLMIWIYWEFKNQIIWPESPNLFLKLLRILRLLLLMVTHMSLMGQFILT